ncbi:hypothetical protein PHSY_001014 [Pseudozyma hubeiensis SY62]|uniref:Secreted protein n=1 Tax=Pseudozyma hubeiensis (strain SY62) TaxID=1305764 RepID=R9NXT0_PSEHS|nr:hypothetical protein PHSY_001014 [Pseudozyma hubeiensis SY62]GAC93449.1 hypothetical protein PHSY_001014 [Pseudozyma hubeiensis SY62]
MKKGARMLPPPSPPLPVLLLLLERTAITSPLCFESSCGRMAVRAEFNSDEGGLWCGLLLRLVARSSPLTASRDYRFGAISSFDSWSSLSPSSSLFTPTSSSSPGSSHVQSSANSLVLRLSIVSAGLETPSPHTYQDPFDRSASDRTIALLPLQFSSKGFTPTSSSKGD